MTFFSSGQECAEWRGQRSAGAAPADAPSLGRPGELIMMMIIRVMRVMMMMIMMIMMIMVMMMVDVLVGWLPYWLAEAALW